MANLIFDRPPLVGSPTNLVFGESETPVLVRVNVAIQAQLPNTLVVTLRAGQPVRATVVASLPNTLAVSAGVVYDNRVTPWKDQRAAMAHQRASNSRALLRSDWGVSASSRQTSELLWHPGARHAAGVSSGLQTASAANQQSASEWGLGQLRAAATNSSFQKAIARSATAAAAWQLAAAQGGQARISLQTGIANQAAAQARWNTATAAGIVFTSQSGASLTLVGRQFASSPWQVAMRAAPGRSSNPPVVLPPVPGIWSADLLFECPPLVAPIELIFGSHPCSGLPIPSGDTVVVPIRKVYVVLNNASLRRIDGNLQIATFGISLSLDIDSWTWQFSASMPAQMLSLLEPSAEGDPVEVEAMINGSPYQMLVESISRERVFGQSSIRVSGRGIAATLDAPYAPVSSFTNTGARTAQQLMNDVLTINGVSLGWTVNWGLTDWLVPAGVFNHNGSYISAINSVATAAGGYLQPSGIGKILNVLPRYKAAPWNWTTGITPDFELPADVVTRESIEWSERARYNRVYVSGESAGILGQVTRAGTAGDLAAPMVVDSLITHADAARQRGTAVLSDTGRVANISLRLPVLAETNIIVPGKYVDFVDAGITRRGVVRSVQVETSGVTDIWQTIGVETHA